MSGKKIAVEGCAFSTNPGGYTVTPIGTSVLDSKVKCDGHKPYHALGFSTVSGYYVGTGIIAGTTQKVLGSSLPFCVETDMITITATMTVTPFSTQSVGVTIQGAGQNKVAAE
jgi:hypothetical protein